MTLDERVRWLVAMVGGPAKAASVTGRSLGHIDNIRKPGAVLRLDDMLALSKEAGVSVDWVATGYQVRPDIAAARAGLNETAAVAFGVPEGYVRLRPLKGRSRDGIELWDPSPFGVTAAWLQRWEALPHEFAAYFNVGDDGAAPDVPKGATAIVDTRPAKLRDGLYALQLGDDFVARRLIRLPGGTTELVADNMPSWRYALPAGGPEVEIHRIVWAGRDF